MNVPKLRFKDDDGREFPEWEVKLLGEISKFLDGRRRPIKKSDRSKIKGHILIMGPQELLIMLTIIFLMKILWYC